MDCVARDILDAGKTVLIEGSEDLGREEERVGVGERDVGDGKCSSKCRAKTLYRLSSFGSFWHCSVHVNRNEPERHSRFSTSSSHFKQASSLWNWTD
jgi:hypothetical protein